MREWIARVLLGGVVGLLAQLSALPIRADAPPLRHHDDRTPLDLPMLQRAGIQHYESKSLLLLTDIDPAKARKIVTLVDQVFPAWKKQFGPLPEARDQSDFQITGYVMKDAERFKKAGLIRESLPEIIHGQHSGYEFWMHEVEYDYYREHLLLHEATHCVMQCLDDGLKPLWYLEGMAEYFGAHESTGQGIVFGVIPASRQSAMGFGRIEMIRRECEEGRAFTAADVVSLGSREFRESRSTPYAWSWAFCTFLSRHPAFRDDFRALCQHWDRPGFELAWEVFWKKHSPAISSEWEIFRDSLCYGWDIERGASVPATASVNLKDEKHAIQVKVAADRGWQSMGLKVSSGQKLRLKASGRVVLGMSTKPLESEAQGISFRYSEGRPIGRLLGAVLRDSPLDVGSPRHWEFFEVGAGTVMAPTSNGELFLRVNDRWNELSDNTGSYVVDVMLEPPVP